MANKYDDLENFTSEYRRVHRTVLRSAAVAFGAGYRSPKEFEYIDSIASFKKAVRKGEIGTPEFKQKEKLYRKSYSEHGGRRERKTIRRIRLSSTSRRCILGALVLQPETESAVLETMYPFVDPGV